jgi:hypothetical protein
MRLRHAAVLIPFIAAVPAFAGTLDTPGCRRELAAVSATMDEAARTKALSLRSSEAACAAYRSQFLLLVKARAVVAACKTGPDREEEVGRLDGTVEDINVAIAQNCS